MVLLFQDTPGTINKIAQFLGKDLTEEEKKHIMAHCSFEQMKDNNMTNHSWFINLGVSDPKRGEFMRKGQCHRYCLFCNK